MSYKYRSGPWGPLESMKQTSEGPSWDSVPVYCCESDGYVLVRSLKVTLELRRVRLNKIRSLFSPGKAKEYGPWKQM